MLPLIIKLCFRKVEELAQYLLPDTGLIVPFSKLFIKQPVKVVSITIIVAGSFCFHYGINDAYALSERVELENILEVDDSEAFPAIEEKVKADVNARKQLNEKTEEPMVSVSTERRMPGTKVLKLFNLGVYYQKQGNTVKAIEEYGRVLDLDPDDIEAHNNLGVIYKEQNDLDKAEMHFTHVISLNPAMDEAHNNLGLIYYLKGNQRGAVSEFQKALELNPDNLMSQINMGLIYKLQGLELKAIDTLEEVLLIEPFHSEAHYNLAILYEGLGHLERATWHYAHFVDNAGAGYIDLTRKVSEHIKKLKVASGNILKE